MLKQITTLEALQNTLAAAEGAIGFVPTMGALHAGHMALVARACAENARVVVSIFVNPLQFGAGEDLERYPRPLDEDLALLEAAGVDMVFLPTAAQMYPSEFHTIVHVRDLGDRYCGASRPRHFDGVTTVVLKLFNLVRPARAYFGEKDFQQLTILRRMVTDLNLPICVEAVPTQRESDGLAMSSRNRYLSPQQRQIAPQLYAALCSAATALKQGQSVHQVLENATQMLLAAGFSRVDYLALVEEENLAPLDVYKQGSRLLVAAFLGNTRLIDNLKIA